MKSLSARLSGWLLLALLAACSPKLPQANQVAIRVNGDEVSVHQVELALQARTAATPPAAASAAASALLMSLVDQELAAQAARQLELDHEPQVIQQLEAAKRQVLAQAYRERIGSRAVAPSSDEIDRYYDAHPELFAKRRFYQLQETTVGVPADRFGEFEQGVEAAGSLAEVQAHLSRQRLKSVTRQLSISAEDLPLNVLSRLAQMKDSESLALPREGGARVLTLLGTQPAPLGREVSSKLIAQFLTNERHREMVGSSIRSLREQAKVEYLGRYAAAAPGSKVQPADPRGR